VCRYNAECGGDSRGLLGAGASVSARLNGGRSALHLSARHPAQVSKLLLNAGAEVDAQSQDGNTPLHDAVTEGNIEMIDLLIFYSASLDLKNNIQHTPLTLAIESKNFSMTRS
jgi:FOG: Ankyrin repeat